MKRLVLLLVCAVSLSSCTNARVATRDALLRQIRENLAEDVGPKYRRYLDDDVQAGRKRKAIADADFGVVTTTILSIDRVVGHGVAPVTS